mmetsp:Transcript_19682/g.61931  ORF Transcript_19682/g.61931 Transcript_19682/m.61931 type:complete len:249 (-) Transcript_19682:963-1709(-)
MPMNRTPANARNQRQKSAFRTRHSQRASSMATRLTTEEMTMLARTKRGSLRANFGRKTRVIKRNRDVTSPANGVRAPMLFATADRENEPATGYPEKREPMRLALPTARISRVDDRSSPCFAASDLPIAMDSNSPTKAADAAVGRTREASLVNRLNTVPIVAGGSPLGMSPTTSTCQSSRNVGVQIMRIKAATQTRSGPRGRSHPKRFGYFWLALRTSHSAKYDTRPKTKGIGFASPRATFPTKSAIVS